MAQINILPAAAQVGGCSATYESYYTGTGDIGFGPQGKTATIATTPISSLLPSSSS